MTPACSTKGYVEIEQGCSLSNDTLVENVCKFWTMFCLALLKINILLCLLCLPPRKCTHCVIKVPSPWLKPTTFELRKVFRLRWRHIVEPLIVGVWKIEASVRVSTAHPTWVAVEAIDIDCTSNVVVVYKD